MVSPIVALSIADAPLPLLISGTCAEGQCTGLAVKKKIVHKDHVLTVGTAVEQHLSCALPKNHGYGASHEKGVVMRFMARIRSEYSLSMPFWQNTTLIPQPFFSLDLGPADF